MSGIFNSIDISATGMTIQRRKMDVVAQNIANVETTRTKDGGPYRRKRVMVEESRDQTSFSTAMKKAVGNLARTNPSHLSASGGSSRGEIEISKASAEEVEDPASNYKMIHDPSHPDADDKGFVKMPDIEIITEMVDMMAASRAYEANTSAIMTAKEMAKNALEI
jgi:flagellar basal-body rod protein FlgC